MTAEPEPESPHRFRRDSIGGRALAAVFGDRIGLALFLGSVCVLLGLTRVGIFITDTYTVANAFVALTDGHLSVGTAFYGESLNTPGMEVIDGRHYGRNYGQLVASLPAYLVLEGLSAVADLRIALVAVWSLALLGCSLQVGHLLDRREAFAVGGSVTAVLAFFAHVAVATPLGPRFAHLLALQLSSLLAGALLGVVTYRLVRTLRSRRLGVVAAVVVVYGTPIALWSPIPKRHVFSSLLIVAAIYALVLSRERDDERVPPRYHHAAAYACVGLLAWIHMPEAFVLFVGLAVADAATRPELAPRRVRTVTAVLLLSLVPVALTNFLITGNPLLSTRVASEAGASVESARALATASLTPPLVAGALRTVLKGVSLFTDQLVAGVETALSEPDRVYHTFVRSGYAYPTKDEQAVNLSVLESAPVLAALVAGPAMLVARVRNDVAVGADSGSRAVHLAAGLAVVIVGVLLSLVYIERLPLYAQVTARYLVPVFVLAAIGIVVASPLGRALDRYAGTAVWSLSAGVLLGGQILFVVVARSSLAVGEAFQFHALVGLAVAVALAVWTLAATATDRFDRLGAVLAGLAVASTAVLTLFVVLVYTDGIGFYQMDGDQALPLARLLSAILSAF